jgi:hypothetical protein
MISRHIHDEPSTGELISRLTRETTALVKAEAERIKFKASSLVGPGVALAVLAVVAAGTYLLGLLAFGFALFIAIRIATGSMLIGGIAVGASAWIFTVLVGAICASIVRKRVLTPLPQVRALDQRFVPRSPDESALAR